MLINKEKNTLIIIFILLSVGLLFYYFFRQNIIGLNILGIENNFMNIQIEGYLNSFPSLIHVVILTLLTWYILNFKFPIFSVLLWVSINSLFEFLQHTSWYFINSTFDWIDVYAILIGGIFSYLIIIFINKIGEV